MQHIKYKGNITTLTSKVIYISLAYQLERLKALLTWRLPGIAIYYSVEQAFYGLQLVVLCKIVHVLEVEVYYSCKGRT